MFSSDGLHWREIPWPEEADLPRGRELWLVTTEGELLVHRAFLVMDALRSSEPDCIHAQLKPAGASVGTDGLPLDTVVAGSRSGGWIARLTRRA